LNLVPTAAQGKTAVALRYAVAPMCVAVAALLQVSPAGELSQPIGYFVLGVVAAGWFGGSGPGILAAFLSALVLPHLIAAIYPQWPVYALFAGYFDLPRFIVLGLTGFVVGWGTASLRRTQRQLSKVREKLETTVAERTANLAESEARYARAMEATGAGHTDWNLVTGEFYVSPRLLEILGHPPGATFADRADWVRRFPFHPEDRPKWQAAVDAHLASREAKFKNEWRIVVRGETRWVAFTFIATRDAAGKPVRWSGSVADITEQKRAAALLAGEKHLLEMMARGTPLSTVLDALCRIIEENVSGGLCGISLVDATGTVLDNGASPSLPRGYMQAIAGKAMERDAGPCCMAAVLNEQVIAADVATETRWPAWCTLALSHGLRAIWSTPITSSANKALGTFAIYFMRPSRPTHEQLAIIERFSHAAAVAIERSNAEQSLRQSEERYALAVAGSDDVPHAVVQIGRAHV